METATDGFRRNECSNDKMTELQRELELFEASERHEDTHFLSAIRPDKHQEEEEEAIQEQADKRPPVENNQGKKKRGRKPKSQMQAPLQIQSSSSSPSSSLSPSSSRLRKKVEQKTEEGEDVCFICHDGGDLVLCDRKSCTKAYHPTCVGRDQAFFQTKGPWTCGWHLCTVCEKPAKFLCHTCTFSVCEVCVKDSEFLRVRKNRGFCENCMPLVLMIEENKEVNSDGEECKRLRQSVRCGLVHRPTVSELQEKAKALHEVKLNDWFETELLRLSHLRDRASEKGLRKELRECVEKLQLLSSPDERARKLQETPDVIADPNVDPGYDSDEEKTADNNQGAHSNQWDKGSSKKGWDGAHQISTKASDNSKRNTSAWGQSAWERGPGIAESHGWSHNHNENNNQNNKSTSSNLGTEKAGNEHKYSDWESQTISVKKSDDSNTGWSGSYAGTAILDSSSNWQQEKNQSQIHKASTIVDEFSTRPDLKEEVSETEKVWHYKDPTCKIQGPFSMLQLRKWNTTGFFPTDLRIWKTHEKQDDSILLTDALTGKFGRDSNSWEAKSHLNQTSMGSKVAVGGKNPNGGWRGNGISTWMGSERNNISPRSSWQMDTGCGSSANDGELTRTTDHQSFGWDNSTDVQKLGKSENDGWGAPQSSGNTWAAPSSAEAPPSSNEGLSGPPINSQSSWAAPSAIEAPKSADAGWGGGTNEVWGTPKSSGGMLSVLSAVEVPKSSDGSWLGGPKESWVVPKSSVSMWSSLKTPETSNSAKGGWFGGHVEGRGTPQPSENTWKDPSTNLGEVLKSTNQGWGASQNSEASISSNKSWDRGPDDGWGAAQNSEIVLSTQTVEVPKSTSQDWGGGPTEGWVATTTQCSDNPWKISPSVIVDTPKCLKENWGDPQSSENLFSAPAPNPTTDGWGAPPSSENLCATVSAVEACKSTNECWGAPQSSEKSWTAQSTGEASKTRSEGWGSSPTEGWGGSGGWDQASGRTENSEMGKVAGMRPWSTQTSCHESGSAGKLHNRPPNEGFRPSRNSKKDTPCRFHERGFCRKGSNCEFRHG